MKFVALIFCVIVLPLLLVSCAIGMVWAAWTGGDWKITSFISFLFVLLVLQIIEVVGGGVVGLRRLVRRLKTPPNKSLETNRR